MKKVIVLLSLVVIFMTGCSVTKLDGRNYEKNIETLLSKKNSLYNVYYDGYKYYLTKGISFIDKDEYNSLLKDKYNNKYYLYVDAIGYYHKIENTYKENSKSYYSKKLEYKKGNGYIQIDEVDNNYFIQFVYNYVKIEAYVSRNSLVDSINNMCYILRSVKFNDSVLESMIGENALDYKEEDYSLFKADSTKETYMDIVERSETDAYKKDLEDEKIKLDY